MSTRPRRGRGAALALAEGAAVAALAGLLGAAGVDSAQAAGGPPERQDRVRVAEPHHPINAPTRERAHSPSSKTSSTHARTWAEPRDTTTTTYEVAGITVIHRRATSNEVVAANLYLLGGTRQLTASNAGIEALLLEVSERGTRNYTKDVLRRTMARLGSEIVVDADEDWTMFGLRSTVAGFDSTWMVLADRLMYPRLDTADVALVREQFAAAVRQRRDSPDALVDYLADSVAFAGHAYALPPTGTERSIAAIDVGALRRYHDEQVVRSRLLLVVVGNVERSRVERLVQQTIAKLPAGQYRWTLPPEVPAASGGPAVVQRTLPTNYILGYYAGPPSTSPDYQALRIAAAVLSGRLFTEIRSRRNLTYAVNAPFVDRAISAGGLYVTTIAPDTVLALMRREIFDLQTDSIAAASLERLVQQFITEYFLDNETNAAQANFLARAQLYRGDYHEAERFVDQLRDVSPQDVMRVARRYMRNVRFAYVGDSSRFSRASVGRF